jgi:hypothetical protein
MSKLQRVARVRATFIEGKLDYTVVKYRAVLEEHKEGTGWKKFRLTVIDSELEADKIPVLVSPLLDKPVDIKGLAKFSYEPIAGLPLFADKWCFESDVEMVKKEIINALHVVSIERIILISDQMETLIKLKDADKAA